MISAKNEPLANSNMGLGDELMQQVQNIVAERRKSGGAVQNPLALGDITQSSLGMAATMLGFGTPGGAGGPLAKTMGLV